MPAEENMKKNLLLLSLITSHMLTVTYKVVDEQQNPIPNVQVYNSFDGVVDRAQRIGGELICFEALGNVVILKMGKEGRGFPSSFLI